MIIDRCDFYWYKKHILKFFVIIIWSDYDSSWQHTYHTTPPYTTANYDNMHVSTCMCLCLHLHLSVWRESNATWPWIGRTVRACLSCMRAWVCTSVHVCENGVCQAVVMHSLLEESYTGGHRRTVLGWYMSIFVPQKITADSNCGR